jgi:hypothetical protein
MATKISIKPTATGAGTSWTPRLGPVSLGFLKQLAEAGRSQEVLSRIEREALSILGGTVNPGGGPSQNTGLVLGRVQSGKTSSFTAVSALAHDNGFKVIIVIAGTTNLLVEQTTDRLIKDLRLDTTNNFRWCLCPFSDPKKGKASAAQESLARQVGALSADDEPLVPGIPLVVVMKNATHLLGLNKLLSTASIGRDFARLPALIIDDEAHMHSPNVGKDDAESASEVYKELRNLLAHFPTSTLLQYTATPQANLLMEITSELSPDFIRLLEPGPGYVGGKEIFGQTPSLYLREIEESEYREEASVVDPAPKSLLMAFANFLLTSAIDYKATGEARHHAMLVHSDVKMQVHEVFHHWLTTTRDNWKTLLGVGRIPDPFAGEWKDLANTLSSKMKGVEISTLLPTLIKILDILSVQTINSKADVGKVNFNDRPYWVINGGNILGVGYTIEGLVTTHMMRRPGGGMADTIQQRGRFFGYKNNRLEEVRLFTTKVMATRFKDYAEHEEGLRASLAEFDQSNPRFVPSKGTLKDWKRAFWLDPAMSPTRKKAQRLVLERADISSEGWIPQKRVAPSPGANLANISLTRALCTEIQGQRGGWRDSSVWGGNSIETSHLESEISVERLQKFLTEFTLPVSDQRNFSAAMLAIENRHLRDEMVSVVLMAGTAMNGYANDARISSLRYRTIEGKDEVRIFQGDSKNTKSGYLGDKRVSYDAHITLQIHVLKLLTDQGGKKGSGSVFLAESPMIAVRLPSATKHWCEGVLQQA